MRKFNFNSFKKNQEVKEKQESKPRYSAYRTIMSKHEAIALKLKDEPVANIKNP
jgi:hypothetical protein